MLNQGPTLKNSFNNSQVVKRFKNPPANAGDTSSIPESGRSPGGGDGNLLQYSCLDNPMHRGAWRATVHGVAKSWTQLSTHMHSRTSLKALPLHKITLMVRVSA